MLSQIISYHSGYIYFTYLNVFNHKIMCKYTILILLFSYKTNPTSCEHKQNYKTSIILKSCI